VYPPHTDVVNARRRFRILVCVSGAVSSVSTFSGCTAEQCRLPEKHSVQWVSTTAFITVPQVICFQMQFLVTRILNSAIEMLDNRTSCNGGWGGGLCSFLSSSDWVYETPSVAKAQS
jgi:hypothetical protein